MKSNSQAIEPLSFQDLLGNKVQVYSNSGDDGCDDVGILESYDHPFLTIRKNKGDLFCFSIYNVRLIKLLQRIKASSPETSLLRPIGGELNAEVEVHELPAPESENRLIAK